MMDPIRGAGPGNTRSTRSSAPTAADRAAVRSSESTGPGAASENAFLNRLGSVSSRLETLLQRHAALQARGMDTAEEGEALEREISAAQIAFQNILSTDTQGEPDTALSLPPGFVQGVSLQPKNVLQLLE